MNAFQILNPQGEPLSMKQLDAEAAAFWSKEVDEKWYANPTPVFVNDKNLEGAELSEAKFRHEMRQASNWYDTIGWNIANQGNQCSGWSNVVATMMAMQLGMKFIDLDHDYKTGPIVIKEPVLIELPDDKCEVNFPDKLAIQLWATVNYFKPYIELMNHWQSKGYMPKQVKE